jgi:hypothetical protein
VVISCLAVRKEGEENGCRVLGYSRIISSKKQRPEFKNK